MKACSLRDRAVPQNAGRRGLLGATLGAATLAVLPPNTLLRTARAGGVANCVPASGALLFDVFRHDSKIGTHSLHFTRAGDALVVHIDVAMRIALGPLTLFRYRMQAIERWQGDRFVGLNASGDNNGSAFSTQAVAQGDQVAITAAGVPHYLTPPGALPLTHWNMHTMTTPLFNPQTGRMMNEHVRDIGTSPMPMPPAGGPAQARRFSLTGEQAIDDWYDDAQWIALSAIATDGSTVLYRRS